MTTKESPISIQLEFDLVTEVKNVNKLMSDANNAHLHYDTDGIRQKLS